MAARSPGVRLPGMMLTALSAAAPAQAAPEASGETFSSVMDHVAQGFEVLGRGGAESVGIVWSFVLAVVAAGRARPGPARLIWPCVPLSGGTLLLGLGSPGGGRPLAVR